MNKFVSALVLPLVAIAAMASTAHAVPFAPGDSITSLPPSAVVFTGTLLTSSTSNFASTAIPGVPTSVFSGMLTTSVYQEASNPLGGLTFVYRVYNTSGPGSINSLALTNFFTGHDLDLTQGTVTSGTPRQFFVATRSGGNGNDVDFTYTASTGAIAPGQSSYNLIFRTSALGYQSNSAIVSNFVGGSASGIGTFSPVVPEPGMIAFAMTSGVGLLGMGIRARRRRSTSDLTA